jgi:transposase
MKRIHTIGLDVSKNIFQVHGADKSGTLVSRRRLQRKQVAGYFKRLKPCVVGIEATGGVHYWGRLLGRMGHTVKVMPAAYVKPYVKTNKNDVIDAEAICEAVRRPNMRFVPVKTEDEQAVLTLHRFRSILVAQRIMLSNAMRGFLLEFGIVVPTGNRGTQDILQLSSDGKRARFPDLVNSVLQLFKDQYLSLMKNIATLERLIDHWHKSSTQSQRLSTIPQIGTITATALAASIGDSSNFKSGRHLAAWLGLVPRQYSSGGKTVLGHIPWRRDHYLRKLLFLSARRLLSDKSNLPMVRWARRKLRKKPLRVVAIALANKIARVAWALLSKNVDFREAANA